MKLILLLLHSRSIITSCLLVAFLQMNAQTKVTDTDEQAWFGYFNQTRVSNKWGLWGDFHFRTKDKFVTDLYQALGRIGVMYYVNNDAKLTAGYAFVNHFPADNHKNISQPEHRPWQQFQWHTKYSSIRLMQWVRLEERFRRKIANDNELADGYNFNFRVRYNILSQFALGKSKFKKGSLSFVVSDEVFVNVGKQIVYNYFDQNRFFAGFHYYVNDHDQLQFGYMNLFQQLAAGNKYRSNHVARLFFFHTLDLRKKEKL